ncbi:MAG: hypothetical protein LUG18_15825 [Candidatus Azobacteroides sp.]|nr:hypothetical protein [Candidatus Azobacteroides sp.]
MRTIYLTVILSFFSCSIYSQYPTLSGNNIFTGTNTFNAIQYFNNHIKIKPNSAFVLGSANPSSSIDGGYRLSMRSYQVDGVNRNFIDYYSQLFFRVGNSSSTLKNVLAMNQAGEITVYNIVRVESKIISHEIQVKANVWSDFVFDPSYTLPSLKEVKSHIEENRHLPGIPSESEVLENGINVSDMTAKLLQKVEELTLYAIQQQETIENQAEIMKQQQQAITSQEENIHILNQKISHIETYTETKK